MVSQNDVILADEWFFKAKQALGFARTGLPEAQYHDWICFLCHQAVELYSKGLLVLHHIKPPRSHDLSELFTRCVVVDEGWENLSFAAKTLAPYYIESRYPLDVFEIRHYSREQAEEAVRLAGEIEEHIMNFRKEATISARSNE